MQIRPCCFMEKIPQTPFFRINDRRHPGPSQLTVGLQCAPAGRGLNKPISAKQNKNAQIGPESKPDACLCRLARSACLRGDGSLE